MSKVEESKSIVEQMKKIKEKTEVVEKDNDLLADRNRQLGIRAAVCFEELTPRYASFQSAFEELGIEKPKPEYKSIGKISSISYIEKLLSMFKNNKHSLIIKKEPDIVPPEKAQEEVKN